MTAERARVATTGWGACLLAARSTCSPLRGLFRRLGTAEVGDPGWLALSFPTWWHYDVLRALDHFRTVGGQPDARLAEAVAVVRARRSPDGTWPLDHTHPCAVHVTVDEGEGRPSRWTTLRALRVLRWWGND